MCVHGVARGASLLLVAFSWGRPGSAWSDQAPVAQTRALQPLAVTAFVNVSVIPMDSERMLAHQTVVVQGDRIVAFGPAKQVRVPARAARVDGRGRFLIPGLGNMHAHIQDTLVLDSVPSSALLERMLLGFLRDGYTTVRNMDGRPWHLTVRARVARGELLGPRIYTAGPVIPNARPLRGPADAAQAVAEQHAAGYDFIKPYDGVSSEAFDSLIAAAGRLHVPVGGHTPEQVGVERMLQAHVASIEHLTGYIEYLSGTPGRFNNAVLQGQFDEAKLTVIARATQRAGVWNVPTFSVLGGSLLGDKRKPVLHYRGSGKIVKALHDAGAGLLLGTDGSPVRQRLPVEWELQMLVLAGLTPYDALATGTRNVAQFFGTLDTEGTVAVGKRADLVLLMGNPLEDISNVGRQAGVMVNGRWVTRAALAERLQKLARVLGPMPPSIVEADPARR